MREHRESRVSMLMLMLRSMCRSLHGTVGCRVLTTAERTGHISRHRMDTLSVLHDEVDPTSDEPLCLEVAESYCVLQQTSGPRQ